MKLKLVGTLSLMLALVLSSAVFANESVEFTPSELHKINSGLPITIESIPEMPSFLSNEVTMQRVENWPSYPGGGRSTDNPTFMVPYSVGDNYGKFYWGDGELPTNTYDWWTFYATKNKTHSVVLLNPPNKEYYYMVLELDLVTMELEQVTDGFTGALPNGAVTVINLPGADPQLRIYYVLVLAQSDAEFDSVNPYRLLLFD